MERSKLNGVRGWLLLYLIGSVPLLLIVLKSPRAPRWNIALLWIATVLMTLRSVAVILMPSGTLHPMSLGEALGVAGILVAIIGTALGWAILWTQYFRLSARVRATFPDSSRSVDQLLPPQTGERVDDGHRRSD